MLDRKLMELAELLQVKGFMEPWEKESAAAAMKEFFSKKMVLILDANDVLSLAKEAGYDPTLKEAEDIVNAVKDDRKGIIRHMWGLFEESFGPAEIIEPEKKEKENGRRR